MDQTCILLSLNLLNHPYHVSCKKRESFLVWDHLLESREQCGKMEWPIHLVIFDSLPNNFELSFLIKIIFSIISVFIIIFGLLVHRRILSFVKKNDDRNVNQIIWFQSVVNCFLIPIGLSWIMGLQWFGEMKQFISPQGCYIGTFIGILL